MHFLASRKSVVLVIVIGVVLVLSSLALAALTLMTQESRISEAKIKRIRAMYAVQAAMVHSLERLRRSNVISSHVYVGAGVEGYPSSGIDVSVTRVNGSDNNATLTIQADY